MQSILTWLGTNWMGVAVAIVSIDRILERLFPNAKVLKAIDELGSKVIPPQS